MKNKHQKYVVGFLSLFMCLAPAFSEDAWFERIGQGISLIGGAYAVNYVHESGHFLVAEALNYDADIEVHPFSGHAEIEAKTGSRLNSQDRTFISIAGPVTTRATYEFLNSYLSQRPTDWLTPFLSWTAVGLRLDLPWQQGKAVWAHMLGRSDRRDSDMNQFYDNLSGGQVERRVFNAVGTALVFWDLWMDLDEVMTHISGGLGEEPLRDRPRRKWFLNSDGSTISFDWRHGF